MKDIGIRNLKPHASDLVRQVSENAPERAWERLTMLADKIGRGGTRYKSAVRELEQARR